MLSYLVTVQPYTSALRSLLKENHYTQAAPQIAAACMVLKEKDSEDILGVIVFTHPTNNSSKLQLPNFLELSRMWVSNKCQKNTESYFLGKALKLLDQMHLYSGVYTFADPTVGHTGTIYRATNFKYLGITKASYHYLNKDNQRVNKRQIWKAAKKAKVSEKAYAEQLQLTKVSELPKHKFVYFFNRTFKTQENVFGEVYIIRNLKNPNKVYIGCTTTGIKARFKKHLSDAKNGSELSLHASMRKHGFENFKVEKLGEANTRLALLNLENKYINQFSKTHTLYNVTKGYDVDSYVIPDSILYESLNLRKQGMLLQDIAKYLKLNSDYLGSVHAGRVKPHILDNWVKDNGPHVFVKLFSEQEKMDILKMYVEGVRISKIASKFKTSPAYVRKLIKGEISPEVLTKLGLSPTTPLNPLHTPYETLIEVYKAHFIDKVSVRDLKTKYKIQESSLYRILKGITHVLEFKEWSKSNPHKMLPAPPREKMAETLAEDIKRLKEEGLTNHEVAEVFGLSYSYMVKLVREFKERDANFKPKEVKIKKHNQKTIYVDGKEFPSIKEAADYVGCSGTAIRKALKKDKVIRGFKLEEK